MKKYRHLSQNERGEIVALLNRGLSLRKIAFWLGRSHTSLSRELRRNKGPHRYRSMQAHQRAHQTQRNSHRRSKRLQVDRKLQKRIIRDLKKGWSPEIIAGRLKREEGQLVISYETIYTWIYSEQKALIPYLVRSHPRRRPRWQRAWPKRIIEQRVSIDKRPSLVNERQAPGHWETDLVCGKGKSALQVLAERKTRFTKILKVRNKTAQVSFECLVTLFSKVEFSLRQTITYDNGSENSLHVYLNKKFSMASYFCAPYHAWEKGSVENTNGLIRRFLPKRTDFDNVSPSQIRKVETWLNHRPRKCLDFQTPAEAYLDACGAIAP